MQKHSGFTLIECLVALFIVAVVLASATRSIGVIISDVHDSFVREVATWVADNEYNTYLINQQFPEVGSVKKSIMSAGIGFNVVETVSNTPNPYFRRVEIAISETTNPDYTVYKTINFISQY